MSHSQTLLVIDLSAALWLTTG